MLTVAYGDSPTQAKIETGCELSAESTNPTANRFLSHALGSSPPARPALPRPVIPEPPQFPDETSKFKHLNKIRTAYNTLSPQLYATILPLHGKGLPPWMTLLAFYILDG